MMRGCCDVGMRGWDDVISLELAGREQGGSRMVAGW